MKNHHEHEISMKKIPLFQFPSPEKGTAASWASTVEPTIPSAWNCPRQRPRLDSGRCDGFQPKRRGFWETKNGTKTGIWNGDFLFGGLPFMEKLLGFHEFHGDLVDFMVSWYSAWMAIQWDVTEINSCWIRKKSGSPIVSSLFSSLIDHWLISISCVSSVSPWGRSTTPEAMEIVIRVWDPSDSGCEARDGVEGMTHRDV